MQKDGRPYPWWQYMGDPGSLLSARYAGTVRHIAMRARFCQLMLEDQRIERAVNRVNRKRIEQAAWQCVHSPEKDQDDASTVLLKFRALRVTLDGRIEAGGLMSNPRIGRPDVLAALVCPQSAEPVHSLDDVAERAREIADSLAHLTRLTGFVRRRNRGDVERRARLNALHDDAIKLWHELGRLADEASEHSAPGHRP